MAEPSQALPGVYCARLRSKKLWFLQRPPRTEADVLDGSGHCWCRTTMDTIGPDGRLVDPEDCRAGRRCFDPSLPSLS